MSQEKSPRRRRELLINGRRVRLADLLDAELLKAGQRLYFPHRGMIHESVVTERGRLRLEDGSEFDTPSAAGTAVSGLKAVPGWAAWLIDRHGPSLHDLRRKLLKSVAEEVGAANEPSQEAEVKAARERLRFLEEAAAQAKSGHPKTLTVREFIKLWGVEERDSDANDRIDADLDNHGLVTVPDFRAVGMHLSVKLETLSEADESSENKSGAERHFQTGVSADPEEDSAADIGLTLGILIDVKSKLVSTRPSATFEHAITLMQINDFSQLAVLADEHTLHGVVSWESIAAAKHRDADATFSDAIDRRPRDRVFDYNVSLLDALEPIQRNGYIFVRDHNQRISGIITAADVVRKYDDIATPFFLIGQVDQGLRRLIQDNFDEGTVKSVCGSFRSFDKMAIGQYQAVLRNQDCWDQLGWPLDREVFIERLNEIREVRNDVMHFTTEGVKPGEVAKLRNFLQLIRQYSK